VQRADVALLTDRRYTATTAAEGDWYLRNILQDDGLLQAALSELGISSVRVDWSRPDIDWSQFRCAVFRTTWDYFDRQVEFKKWFAVARTQTCLCNDAALIEWNMDKHYLVDLQAKGITIVPSRYIEQGESANLIEILLEMGWDEAIVKPCVSGAARHTYRFNHTNASDTDAIIDPLLEHESFLVQPFQESVLRSGEDTLIFFGSRYTHAVRKIAKPGDFRVQDDHGGKVYPHAASDEQIEFAQQALLACQPAPVYGRVDMIRDNDGNLAIMELELIEPELWLRNHPPSARVFAEALAIKLRGKL
jgi:glutathione synthase/RimK-type ligase-like ATP-grasp enzyme